MRKLAIFTTLAIAAIPLGATAAFALDDGKHDRDDRTLTKKYVADLEPLNAGMHVNKETHQTYEIPRASGWAKLKVTGDDVSVKIKVRGVAPGITHAQHIHAGRACPAPATDPNNDGVLDVIEGLPAYGPILVNLDSDLSSNAAGMFPMANAYGRYTYSAKGSKAHIEAEIQQALRLGTRHVVIHGVDPTTPLPTTVQSLPGLPAHATLPVACGELVRDDKRARYDRDDTNGHRDGDDRGDSSKNDDGKR